MEEGGDDEKEYMYESDEGEEQYRKINIDQMKGENR